MCQKDIVRNPFIYRQEFFFQQKMMSKEWVRIAIIASVVVVLILIIFLVVRFTILNNPEKPEDRLPAYEFIPDGALLNYGVLNTYVVNTGRLIPENPCMPGDILAGGDLNTGVADADHLWLCQEKGISSEKGLVDYKIITGDYPEIQCPESYERVETNLNSGALNKSKWIYLCKKFGKAPYLQDLYVMIGKSSTTVCPQADYYNFGGNGINAGTSSQDLIYLCGKQTYLDPVEPL